MHFYKPQNPRMMIAFHDVKQVPEALRDDQGLHFHSVTSPSAGVTQINLGHGKGAGTLQVYTSGRKLGASAGNARISVGNENRLMNLRAIILRSSWFCDAHSPVAGSDNAVEFQPDGSMLLPALSDASQCTDVKKVLKTVKTHVGSEGNKAMKEYLSRCGITEGSTAFDVFTKVFKDKHPKIEA